MKRLEIEDNKAFFTTNSKTKTPIDQIKKEDLLELLELAIVEDDFTMDEFDKDKISNQAHQIIYENIYAKFKELLQQRTRFKDESENLYKDAFAKYSIEQLV